MIFAYSSRLIKGASRQGIADTRGIFLETKISRLAEYISRLQLILVD